VQCQKPICERHTFVNPSNSAEIFCTTCGKKFVHENQQVSPNAPPGTYYGQGYGYEPYFYTGYYYHDYPYGGYRRAPYSGSSHDFTDADERSLTGGEPTRDDARAFESDMGGS
jgi:hypothetical protein